MIKINKKTEEIPNSLKIPVQGRPSRPAATTHSRRLELINKKKYIDSDNFNSRYKQDDVKTALNDIYKNKCAYCESKLEQLHVEHYRPKKTYYWLAFSWDNLIFACPDCNTYKGTNFDLNGVFADLDFFQANFNDKFHSSSTSMNQLEKPKLINPEKIDPDGFISFKKDGDMESDDECFKYTIKTCKLNREYLKDSRRGILNKFRDILTAELARATSIQEQSTAMQNLIRYFIAESKMPESDYLAFRRFAAKHLLSEIAKEIS